MPGDTAVKIQQTKEPEQKNDFDEWLARIICYVFSVLPQWAVKAMNRATADNQSAQAEDEGLEPTKEWVKDLIDQIITEEFASSDLELVWLAEDDNDLGKNEAALENRVKLGALTLNELRDALGLDPYTNPVADRPMVLTATGYVPIEAGVNGSIADKPAKPADVATVARMSDLSAEASKETKPGDRHTAYANVGKSYDPDQPRVPSGNADGGQWTSSGGDVSGNLSNGEADAISPAPRAESRVMSDVTPDITWKPGALYAQITVQNNAKTGNPEIDQTTETLLQTLARIHAAAGDGSGPWYGTSIHLLFAADVRSQNLPGIGRNGVEQSFSLGDVAAYGEDGTVRVDVYMRDQDGNIIAIWDVKTGGAVLTGARASQLRAESGVGAGAPVIELHVMRGATFKASAIDGILSIIAVSR